METVDDGEDCRVAAQYLRAYAEKIVEFGKLTRLWPATVELDQRASARSGSRRVRRFAPVDEEWHRSCWSGGQTPGECLASRGNPAHAAHGSRIETEFGHRRSERIQRLVGSGVYGESDQLLRCVWRHAEGSVARVVGLGGVDGYQL